MNKNLMIGVLGSNLNVKDELDRKLNVIASSGGLVSIDPANFEISTNGVADGQNPTFENNELFMTNHDGFAIKRAGLITEPT